MKWYKNIKLLTLENDKIKNHDLFLLDLNSSDPNYLKNSATQKKYFSEHVYEGLVKDIALSYRNICFLVYKLYRGFFSSNSNYQLYEKMAGIDLRVALNDAFDKISPKVSVTDDKGKVVDTVRSDAFFNKDEGMTFDISKVYSGEFEKILKHEFGHAMDYLINPVKYDQRSSVMHEVVAIHLEQELKELVFYRENTDHNKAKGLLKDLRKTSFLNADFVTRTDFLQSVLKEEELLELANKKFKKEGTLEKLVGKIKSK